MTFPRAVRAVLFVIYTVLAIEAGARVALQVAKWRSGQELGKQRPFSLTEGTRATLARIGSGWGGQFAFDPVLGWSGRASVYSPPYRHNAQGLRADKDVPPEAPAAEYRIAAFGDSFVHGTDMTNAQTWESVVEREHPGWRVLNFGVGAYGTDQALLRYEKEGRAFRPRLVILGVLSENPLRNVNVFRPFYNLGETGFPLVKPRFILRDGDLELVPCPFSTQEDYRRLLADAGPLLQQLGHDDYFYQRSFAAGPVSSLGVVRVVRHVYSAYNRPLSADGTYNTHGEPFRVTAAILERFDRKVRDDGAIPVVLFFPEREHLLRVKAGGRAPYAPLRDVVAARGGLVIDSAEGLLPALAVHGVDELYGPSRHFSVLGNEIVGRYVASALERLVN